MAKRGRKPKKDKTPANSMQGRASRGRGKRGPAKMPMSKLKVHGSRLAKDRAQEHKSTSAQEHKGTETQKHIAFPCQLPTRPNWCSYKRKIIWNNLISQYREAGVEVLAQVDAYSLARYCDLLAWYLKLRKEVETEGEIKKCFNKNGGEYLSTNPKAQLAVKISTQLTKLETELYLNPASRAGLELKKKPSDDSEKPGSLAAFFKKYG